MDFIESLQQEISIAIGDASSEDLDYKKLDIKSCININDVEKLIKFNEILEQVKYCNSCFQDQKIDDIISKTKAVLNKI